MDETSGKQRLFAAAAFGVLLAAGLAAALAALDEIDERDRALLADPVGLWSGESGRIVARVVNEQFAPRKLFHQVERRAAWLLLGDWGPRVRAGCPGWLFLADELHSYPGREASAALRAGIAERLRTRLQVRGVKLLMVVVPDKSRIEAAHLCGLPRAPHAGPRVDHWVAQLRERQVDVLDLTEALARLPGERYYRTDTHWNESGAQAAAAAIATALRSRGLAPEQQTAPPPLPAEQVQRPGDLVRVAGLDGLAPALRPAPDLVEKRAVPPVAAAGDDLFGSTGLPSIVVVGTSFSRTSNLVPFLARHLGEQVANAAKDGGDFDGAGAAYLASAAFRDSAPKVIVWEVPERLIEEPIKPSERDWMKTLTP